MSWNELVTTVLSQWQQQSYWEVFAVVLAIAYVWLAAKANRWCWPCGFASTAVYTVLFWSVSLPFQSALNGYYMLMAIYGWWHWKNQQNDVELPFSTWSGKAHLMWILGLAVASWLLAQGATHWFVSQQVYLYATVLVFSLFATYLMAQKIPQHWLYWIVIDLAAGYLYWLQGLYLTGLLFYSYFLFSIYGYYQLQRQWKAQSV